MAGLSTGAPDSTAYNLGRGALYFADIDATTGLPDAFRHLGNAPAFSITVDSETLEHQSSLEGLKTVDKEVVVSQALTASLTLDEINFDNLALFLSGTASAGTAQDADGVSGNILWDYDAQGNVAAPLNRWYDFRDTDGATGGDRVFDLTGLANGDVTIKLGGVTLTNTDTGIFPDGDVYEVDLVLGRVFLKSYDGAATNVDLTVDLTANVAATVTPNVEALTTTTVSGALKFVAENPAADDEVTEYQFHKISLKAEGEFSLISDDWTQMQFTGKAEKNTGTDAAVLNKTLSVTSHANA